MEYVISLENERDEERGRMRVRVRVAVRERERTCAIRLLVRIWMELDGWMNGKLEWVVARLRTNVHAQLLVYVCRRCGNYIFLA